VTDRGGEKDFGPRQGGKVDLEFRRDVISNDEAYKWRQD
jgi:hypothetical protein